MTKYDFKLVRRFGLNRIKKEEVNVSTDGKFLFIKIPVSTIPHKTTTSEAEYRAIKGDNTSLLLTAVDVYLEPIAKAVDDGTGKLKEDTSTTRLTAVIDFDSKKPQNEPL